MLARALVLVLWLPAVAWGAAAIWYDGPGSRLLAGTLAVLWSALALAALLAPRSRLRGMVICAALLSGLIGWWLRIEPSNDRDWQPDVARLPSAVLSGERLTLRNVRNFGYRSETDYSERWEERSYDLDGIVGVDMFLCSWGSPWIVHTIASWEFSDGDHLAISIETRKERGEAYSALRGFFRAFELYYVVADERDVVLLRTNHRGEHCRLYRLTTPPERARAALLDYVAEITRLSQRARWYNAATLNCTTAIRQHVRNVGANNPWDWRILMNGRIDELGWERGTVDRSLPFAELRERSEITEVAQVAGDAPDFSARIREGLPGARARPADARPATSEGPT